MRSNSIVLSAALLFFLSGCSCDIIPVHYSRIKSAKYAEQPLLRGPNAPGAFKHAWTFSSPKGYLYDPSELEISDGMAKSKNPGHPAVLVTHVGAQFVALDSFTETLGPKNQGRVAYQVSRNNSAWYYYNGKSWAPAGPNSEMANSAQQLSEHLGSFHEQVGNGSFYVRAYLISPTGKEHVELQKMEVQGIAPKTDGWD